jgi:hypothetical protein
MVELAAAKKVAREVSLLGDGSSSRNNTAIQQYSNTAIQQYKYTKMKYNTTTTTTTTTTSTTTTTTPTTTTTTTQYTMKYDSICHHQDIYCLLFLLSSSRNLYHLAYSSVPTVSRDT